LTEHLIVGADSENRGGSCYKQYREFIGESRFCSLGEQGKFGESFQIWRKHDCRKPLKTIKMGA